MRIIFYKQINSVQKCMQEWLDVHKPNANVYVKMISDWLHKFSLILLYVLYVLY